MSGDHNMKGQCPSCGGDCGRTAKSGCNYGREPAHADHPMRHYDRTCPACQDAEPVAYLWQHCETGRTRIVMPDDVITADATWFVVGPLYLHPAPKQVPMTGEQIELAWMKAMQTTPGTTLPIHEFARAIEAYLNV